MKRLRCLIVDDEKHAAAALQSALERVAAGRIEVGGVAENASRALVLAREKSLDVVFSDIRMPGESGLELARQLPTQMQLVFVTAYDEHAVTAFELGAIDYILKPVDDQRLLKTLDRLGTNSKDRSAQEVGQRLQSTTHGNRPLEKMFVRTANGVAQIGVDEIIRIVSQDGYSCVVDSDGREFLMDLSLKQLERRVPRERFVRLGRSCLANLSHVLDLERHPDKRLRARFSDGKVITASRSASRSLRKRLAQF